MAHIPLDDAIPGWGLWGSLRHTLETIEGDLLFGYGEMFTTATAATTISDTTSYFDLAGTWTLGQARNFDESAGNGRLTFTGSMDIVAFLMCITSVTVAGNNNIIHLRLENTGTAVTSSDSIQELAAGTEVASLTSLGISQMSTNDYITAAVRNETATNNVTAENAHMMVIALRL